MVKRTYETDAVNFWDVDHRCVFVLPGDGSRLMEFLGVIGAVILVFIGIIVGSSCQEDRAKTAFIEKHQKDPYCISSTATVMDKSQTLKRCWKAVEIR